MWTSKPDTNVQVKKHILRKSIINPLFHICQKTKIALEIAAKIASVNGPKRRCYGTLWYVRWKCKTGLNHSPCLFSSIPARFAAQKWRTRSSRTAWERLEWLFSCRIWHLTTYYNIVLRNGLWTTRIIVSWMRNQVKGCLLFQPIELSWKLQKLQQGKYSFNWGGGGVVNIHIFVFFPNTPTSSPPPHPPN